MEIHMWFLFGTHEIPQDYIVPTLISMDRNV